LAHLIGRVLIAEIFVPRSSHETTRLMAWKSGMLYFTARKWSPMMPIGTSSKRARATSM
jgi:hypothetical protein